MNKEYKYFKSAVKTAKENNLIRSGKKNLFDFSLLDNFDISKWEKEYIKKDALKHVDVCFRDQLYMANYDNFTCCSGEAAYKLYAVYTDNGCEHIYNIIQLVAVKHCTGTRKTVYDEYYDTEEKHIGESHITSIDDYRVDIYL